MILANPDEAFGPAGRVVDVVLSVVNGRLALVHVTRTLVTSQRLC